MVPEFCQVIADAGYTGKSAQEKSIFSVRNNLDTKEVAAFKARARARQEQFNPHMKSEELQLLE